MEEEASMDGGYQDSQRPISGCPKPHCLTARSDGYLWSQYRHTVSQR